MSRMRTRSRSSTLVSGTLGLLALVVASAAPAATIQGSNATGAPGQQVSVSFTLLGNGVTRSIGAVFNMPAELSYVGGPSGASPPLQCTTGGISWTNTGSPIPANAGTCTYTVLISAAAAPGVKSITMNQAACDNVCTFNSADVTVTAPNTPPNIAYTPPPGTNVPLTGADPSINATATTDIVATPSGGAGTGAPATTTISGCGISGSGASAFGAPPGSLTFVGATTTARDLSLTCTRRAAQADATLTCTETQGASGPVARSWPISCPAGTATPPTVSYSPPPGTNIPLTGAGTFVNDPASADIVVTPSGGSGGGASATTTVAGCSISGTGANAFNAAPGPLNFVGATTTAQNLTLGCARKSAQADATLTCTETMGGGGPITRSWPISCPAGTVVPPTLTYSPPPGSAVTLGGGSGTVGSSADGSIAVTPSGGGGTGPGATTTVSGCAISGTGAGAFGTAPATLSFNGAAATAQSLALTCTRAVAQADATLSCTERVGGGVPITRSWPIICPLGAQTAPASVTLTITPTRIAQSGDVLLAWNPVNTTACGPSSDHPSTPIVSAGLNRATATVTVGTTARNEVFRVVCNGPAGQVSATATLAVGVPVAPPPPPVDAVSRTPDGTFGNGASAHVQLTDGGRFMVFDSAATNLVGADTNNTQDVFLRDSATGAISRVSTGGSGAQLTGASGEASISRDGRAIVYTTGSGVVPAPGAHAKTIIDGQVCINFPSIGISQCISKAPGASGAPGNGSSNNPSISGDGTTVVFESTATNLTGAPDGNGAIADVFGQTVATGATQILSLKSDGTSATAKSGNPRISCSSNYFVFESQAALTGGSVQPGVKNIYLGSFRPLSKQLVTLGMGGAAANGDSANPVVSDDGNLVFFESSATNLVANDSNGAKDVFVWDRRDGSVRRLSTGPGGVQGNHDSRRPQIPCDAAYMSFESDADNLVAGDSNGVTDTFMLNMGSNTLALMSQANGAAGNGDSANGAVSPDGTSVGFDSSATNLGGGAQRDVFAGANPFTAQNFTGAWYDPAQSGHGLFLDALPDGRLVAWWFTFDPQGNQAWFGGTGPMQGNTATIDVVRTQGARFIPNFVSGDAKNTPVGTLTFSFTGCGRGRVDFALDSTFGSGFMNIERLSYPVGIGCAPAAKAREPTAGPIAAVTGAWYDPAQSGHGLFLENLGDGRLLAWWFTFGPSGGQSWFGGVGTITDGHHATIDFLRTQGGRWIPNFNSTLISNPVLGPATITMDHCDSGRVDFNLQQGYGTGTMALRPLVRAVGTACSE